jgi:DnaJ-class molecular chaperone
VRVGVVAGVRRPEGWVDIAFDDGLRIEVHAGHGMRSSRRVACSVCRGAGEFGEAGLDVDDLARCVPCRGTGFRTPECAACGEDVSVAERDVEAWEGAGVLVHEGCETGDAFFESRKHQSEVA